MDQEQRRRILQNLFERSLLRANQASPPWPEDKRETAMDVWLTALQAIPPEDWPRLFTIAHETRDRRMFSKPLSVDDVKYVWLKLRSGMTWDVRSEQWVDPSGGFYAPKSSSGKGETE